MTTTHPWLEKYPINPDSKYLIIGTHPPMPYCGKLEYYYGNMSEFWRFLDKVYPNNNLYNDSCPKIEDILYFLAKSNFAVTDIVYKTNAFKFSTDSEMGKLNIENLNPFLFEWLKNSKIESIYFTSFGGSNSAKNLFKKWFKKTLKRHSKINNSHSNEIEIFNRKIKLIDLLSPSPTARRSSPRIKEFQDWKTMNENGNYDDFRAIWYKTYFPKI